MDKETFELGRRIRTEVLGSERVRNALDGADEFNRDFQELLTEYCWGRCWGRDGLDRRQRSLIVLAMLAALNRGPEFELHVRAALRNGVTREELKDALMHIAVYCGIPAGYEAFRIATRVLADSPV